MSSRKQLVPYAAVRGGCIAHRSTCRARFTDPAVSFGGGLRFNVSEHLMFRPDIRALVVFADGDTYTMAVYGFNVGYRF